MIIRSILSSLLALLSVQSFAEEKKPAFVYPLEVGMKWTYDTGNNKELAIVGKGTKEVGKKTGIEMVAQIDGVDTLSEVMFQEKGKVYRLFFNGNEVDPPLEVLRLDAKKGDTWKGDFTVNNAKVKTEFSVTIEDVEVPLGKYKSAIVVRADADDGTNRIISTVWYASGVGMVKQKVTLNDQDLVNLQLTKFEKPKK